MESAPAMWQVGAWTVRPDLNEIDGPNGTFRTTSKAMATLLCLAEHQGTVVSRATILSTVWPDTVVSDDTLNRAISDLRSIFGDTPRAPRVIETIRQRGYRLLVPAHSLPAHKPQAPDASPRPLTSQPPLFANTSQRPRQRTPYIIMGCVAVLLGLFGFTLAQSDGAERTTYRAAPLTTYPGVEFDVALSPDGEHVAFSATTDKLLDIDLYIKQVGVETAQRVTQTPGIEISPGWAPDGRALAFLRGDVQGNCGLFILPLPGGDERKLADCHTFLVTGVSWSPDGTTIAFSDRPNRDEPFRIYLLDVATREITTLTDPPTGTFGDFSATFAPDGRSIGFVRGTVPGTTALMLAPALGDLHTVELGSGEVQRLTYDNTTTPHIDWMPDGKHLIFASHRANSTPSLWKVGLDGREPTWVMGGHAFMRKPVLARHTNRLVFEQWNNDVSIVATSIRDLAEGTAPQPLIHSTHVDAAPHFSPDGQHLAFTSERSGSSEVWISAADGSRPIQLTRFGGPFTSSPRWSPNGKQIAFETRIEGQTEVYVVAMTGGPPRRITTDPAEDMVPSWSPDGQHLYFASNRTGAWQVWRTPAGGGTPQPITTEGGFRALATGHPDDGNLYFTRHDEPGLFRTGLTGGSAEPVINTLRPDDWGNWDIDDDAIYFLQRAPTQLIRYDRATGDTEVIGAVQQMPAGMVGLTLTPDAQTIALVQQRHDEADLWIVDGFQ